MLRACVADCSLLWVRIAHRALCLTSERRQSTSVDLESEPAAAMEQQQRQAWLRQQQQQQMDAAQAAAAAQAPSAAMAASSSSASLSSAAAAASGASLPWSLPADAFAALEVLLQYDSSPLHAPGAFPQLAGQIPPSTSIVLLDANHAPPNFDRPPIQPQPLQTLHTHAQTAKQQRKQAKQAAAAAALAAETATPHGISPHYMPPAMVARPHHQPALQALAQPMPQQVTPASQELAQQQQQAIQAMQAQMQAAHAARMQQAMQALAEQQQLLMRRQQQQHLAAAQAQAAQAQAIAGAQARAEAAAAAAGRTLAAPAAPAPPPVAAGPPPTHITVPLSSVCQIQFNEHRKAAEEAAVAIVTDVLHVDVDRLAGFSVSKPSGSERAKSTAHVDRVHDKDDNGVGAHVRVCCFCVIVLFARS